MRNPALREALEAFAEHAAWQLAADTAEGAEVPFELVEAPGSRTPLYCYRPLTEEFIRSRIGSLGRLPTYAPAARALESLGGLEAYLQARGEPRVPDRAAELSDAVLRTFLGAVFGEASDFELDSAHFSRAYEELERLIFETRSLAQVAAPVRGLAITSKEVSLGDGLSLVRADALSDPPHEVQRFIRGGGEGCDAFALLTVEGAPGDGAPVTDARVRFRRLVTALRLYEPVAFVLGPAAWSRIDAGTWQLLMLGSGGRPRGETCRIPPAAEDELRAFCNLVVGRMGSARGELAWALGRFEMGCERLAPFEALTDHLLALRTLLEPEGASSGRLSGRLAALCALPDERPALAERVAHAISLERAVIGGLAPAAPGVDALVGELSDHLRALLRDVLCGHLPTDLVRVAQDVLDRQVEEPEAAATAATADTQA